MRSHYLSPKSGLAVINRSHLSKIVAITLFALKIGNAILDTASSPAFLLEIASQKEAVEKNATCLNNAKAGNAHLKRLQNSENAKEVQFL